MRPHIRRRRRFFFHSLQLIAALPDSTRICCTHEYTLANLQFARYVDPDNRALAEYQASAIEIRACNEPTLPVPLGTEKAINPFLRTASPSLRATLRRLLPLPEMPRTPTGLPPCARTRTRGNPLALEIRDFAALRYS